MNSYSGITHDSRKVEPGYIFVAIPGAKYDGIDFVPAAIAAGAKLIVAERKVEVPAGVEFKKVASARKALAELAGEYYDHPSKKLKLIGITGTKGKTTTAYLIHSILKTAGFKVGIISTINSSMTTPEAPDLQKELAEMVEQGFTHCVMEVSSHGLAQERVFGLFFSIAIFTNLTHDHLDFHKTTDNYLGAKRKLFEMLSPEGIAIINVDDPYGKAMLEVVKGEVITYGLSQARHELRDTRQNEFDTEVTDIHIREEEMTLKINSFEIRTPLIGMHNVYNITAAYQCALALEIPQPTIKKGIEALKIIPGRQEAMACGQPFPVIVDFAHSPDSLRKLLETYRALTRGKVILVFGCPGDRDREKRPIMGRIAVELADQILVTTDDPHSEEPQKIIAEIIRGVPEEGKKVEAIVDRREAIQKALSLAGAGDTVLIAGRGHEKYQDFNGTKVPIDDREVVREILCGRLSGKTVK